MRAITTGAVMLCIASATFAAGGDAVRGQQAHEACCAGCHSVASDRVGPCHAGVFGRRAGSVAGFAYSDASTWPRCRQRAEDAWRRQKNGVVLSRSPRESGRQTRKL